MATKTKVVVYGAQRDAMFVETFDANTGSPLVRFATNGWLAEGTVRADETFDDVSLTDLYPRQHILALFLNHSKVTNEGLAILEEFGSLRGLRLDHTQITDAGVGHLHGLSTLTALDLSGTQITDTALMTIAQLPTLLDLRLGDTQITDQGLRALEKLPKLQAVYLSNTKVTDAGIHRLKQVINDIHVQR